MSRISAAVLAIVCLVTGYALAGSRVHASTEDAQFRQVPGVVNISDHVRLSFAVGSFADISSVECTVVDSGRGWIGCAARDSTRLDRATWYDLSRVVLIQKTEQ